ncbi:MULTISPECIES: TnsD family Tn7-like transposition protein [unclassified Paraburkholderia]|uniref:TnsD family Tn7-like transposition protein n=1 Tax=unclassified Paraburkholderia TaxID=2615204 RepID=UPI002AB009F9|nr:MULTISPECIES: TnsD family Tn7-like transposition protein [unclassified Paraburkholderia]
MSSRTYFPPALDETAVSILAMVVRTTGSDEARRLHCAYQQRANPLANSLPCRAQRFCACTENAYGNVPQVLCRHSLMYWYALGMTPTDADELALSLADGNRRTPCPRFDALLSCGDRTALLCPECAAQDWRKYGRAANHCLHCVDYVTRCPYHEALLQSDGDGSRFEAQFIRPESAEARANSMRYARLAANLANMCPREPALPAIIGLLTLKNFISESGRVHSSALAREFKSYFNAGFEDPRLTHIAAHECFVEFAMDAIRQSRPVHPTLVTLLLMLAREVPPLPSQRPQLRPRTTRTPPETTLTRKRTAWLAVRALAIEVSRSDTRTRAPALWTWLYRHDRSWLEANQLPVRANSAGRKPRASRSTVVEAIIKASVLDSQSIGYASRRESAYETRLTFGIREYALNKMKRTLLEATRT